MQCKGTVDVDKCLAREPRNAHPAPATRRRGNHSQRRWRQGRLSGGRAPGPQPTLPASPAPDPRGRIGGGGQIRPPGGASRDPPRGGRGPPPPLEAAPRPPEPPGRARPPPPP